ncbi:Mitochondrial dicarboxylate transporter-like protein [Hapsidospora chrysogenum ATCC 11550]|uniref:Mitochondrial dicarboxylate transporter-like protein n=1 Tax=Hapsidospora chrysogenum (strain ATCC 11550 / CBS 779.69 / DSM 880 / IAM 14645 / JCM 23072 / IMI 49137) TaxID=857340 RepID=A0A086T8B5_HAPC1|nr:Mitochondrial dicarboxylate transporter-like protein [Hapsidospora chrysogenum ATCC 11550]
MSASKPKEPFWLGGAAARMQVLKSRDPMFRALHRFAIRDGISSLWAGLSASVLRQSTYSTARFGLYNVVADRAKKWTGREKLSMGWTITCAGVAGGLAGVVGNPAEIVLVRMCADGAKAAADRFGYSNAVHGLYRVARDEGLATFGRGVSANITRSVLMNVGQITTYSTAKHHLLDTFHQKDDVGTHVLASLSAGTVATTICAPADVLKSRVQSASAAGSSGGILDIVRTSLREEGPRFLMKGWLPAWLRLTPHTVLTFVFMEQLRRLTQWKMLATDQVGKALVPDGPLKAEAR